MAMAPTTTKLYCCIIYLCIPEYNRFYKWIAFAHTLIESMYRYIESAFTTFHIRVGLTPKIDRKRHWAQLLLECRQRILAMKNVGGKRQYNCFN